MTTTHIFILCHNERVLLPETIAHYRTRIPGCEITIYDNMSTDDSVAIAKAHGCNVIEWVSPVFGPDQIDDFEYIRIKNNCWRHLSSGWVIVIDMDEWLCVTQDDLDNEREAGTTILKVIGLNIIGDSKTVDLSDINMHELRNYMAHYPESKSLCFLKDAISEMNYTAGAHGCNPRGHIVYSAKQYINKHMCHMGVEFYANKLKERHKRAAAMHRNGLAGHYTNDMDHHISHQRNLIEESKNSILENEDPI